MIRVLAVGAAILAGLACAGAAGLRFNTTPSMPVGIWRVTPRGEIARGAIVTACPAAREARRYLRPGDCPLGVEPLVKPVAAVAGDVVTVSSAGVAVNGLPVAHTAQLARDSAGRSLQAVPAGRYRVAPGTVWLLSGHDPRSFDSRYFGPVPISAIRAVMRPVLVLP